MVAEHPSTPPDSLRELADDPEALVRRYVATNHECPPEILEILSRDDNRSVRIAVAQHDRCPTPAFARLSNDPSETVRGAIAVHPGCPVEQLDAFAASVDVLPRIAAATNRATSQAALARLADDPEYDVRRQVADNPSTGPDTLTHLAADVFRHRTPETHEVLARNPASPGPLLAALSSSERVRRSVASNQSCPPDVLDRLANDGDEFVRRNVAGNPQTSPATLARLALDPSDWVLGELASDEHRRDPSMLEDLATHPRWRAAVAEHPRCPPELLAKLSEDNDAFVRLAAAGNPACPALVLKRCAASDDLVLRATVAGNPSTSPQSLVEFAADDDSNVRSAVAANPATRPALLQQLARDENDAVQDVVFSRWADHKGPGGGFRAPLTLPSTLNDKWLEALILGAIAQGGPSDAEAIAALVGAAAQMFPSWEQGFGDLLALVAGL